MRGNSIALAGNIYPREKGEKQLDLRFTPGGMALLNFNLSCWTHKDNRDDENQYTSYRCIAFGDLAEHIAESVEAGDSVIAFGQVRANNWEDKEGNKRYDQEVVIDELGPSLRWGTATINRTERSSGGGGGRSRPQARDDYGEDEAPF